MKGNWVRKVSPNPAKTLPVSKDFSFSLNHVDLSSAFSICGREGRLRLGSSLHASFLKNSNFSCPETDNGNCHLLVVWNSLIAMYSKCGEIFHARKVFDEMPSRDTVSWNSMISGYLHAEDFETGFGFFKRMYDSKIFAFDHATLTSILSACDGPHLLYVVKMIHSLVFLNGLEQEISIGNALITGYFKCDCLDSSRRVFNEMPVRNVITWTAVISSLVRSQFCKESLDLFLEMRCSLVDANSLTYSNLLVACSGLQALGEGRQIHGLVLKLGLESDFCTESALMDMYAKCGRMEDACQIFAAAKELDEVAMTVMLVGFAQNGLEEEALVLFVMMLKEGIEIDPNMASAVLGVFGAITSLDLGKQMHSLIIKRCLDSNPFVANGLINAYSKCGEFNESIKIFDRMACRNSVSWNSMIAGLARHGHGLRALQFYEQMKAEGVEPTDITFLSLLHACSHIGSIERGMELLEAMSKVYGISPRMEHYACVVDMLGRSGDLEKARSFIEELPLEPSILVWQALLGACSIHWNSEIGRYAAERLIQLEHKCPAAYVLMANIYSSEGKWAERAKVIKDMKENGAKKETGMSWIEIEKRVHSFVVEDTVHPLAGLIYEALDGLTAFIREEGYVPDRRCLLYDINIR